MRVNSRLRDFKTVPRTEPNLANSGSFPNIGMSTSNRYVEALQQALSHVVFVLTLTCGEKLNKVIGGVIGK